MFKIKGQSGVINIWVVAVGCLSLAALGFAGLWISSIKTASQAKADLKTARAQSYNQGKSDQRKADLLEAQQQAASPFRSYTAPVAFGAFKLKFPKNWSLYVVENAASNNQLSLILHPDLVRVLTGQDNAYAARVVLSRSNTETVAKQYQERVKTGKLSSRKISVSGIEAVRYDGQFDGKHTGTVVTVPVRDKTLIFTSDDQLYSQEFDQILAQSSIVP